jgi:hypothetical protein
MSGSRSRRVHDPLTKVIVPDEHRLVRRLRGFISKPVDCREFASVLGAEPAHGDISASNLQLQASVALSPSPVDPNAEKFGGQALSPLLLAYPDVSDDHKFSGLEVGLETPGRVGSYGYAPDGLRSPEGNEYAPASNSYLLGQPSGPSSSSGSSHFM